jgi:hypothetical protein
MGRYQTWDKLASCGSTGRNEDTRPIEAASSNIEKENANICDGVGSQDADYNTGKERFCLAV